MLNVRDGLCLRSLASPEQGKLHSNTAAAANAAQPSEQLPQAIPVSDQPTSRGGVLEALAAWTGASPDRRARSDDCAIFLDEHRKRLGTDVVPIGVDWLTPRILAPYGLGKRHENASTFWLVASARPQVSLDPPN